MAAPPASASAATTRQRGGSKAAAAGRQPAASVQQSQQDASTSETLSVASHVNFYIAQYLGIALCALGIGLLAAGYDRGWMHNTTLTLLSLGVCLVGLFFHEFRPFNVSAAWVGVPCVLVGGWGGGGGWITQSNWPRSSKP
jgi:hypothetical protein